MAGKKDKNKNKGGGNKADALKNWLSTNDLLGVGTDSVPVPVANPAATPGPEVDPAQTSGLMARPDSQFITDVVSDVGGVLPPSDGPGSVLPLGAEKGDKAQMKISQMPSSARIAKADIEALTESLKQIPGPESDEGIDLATPPDASLAGPPSLSKILKASGEKSDILRGGNVSSKSGEGSDVMSGAMTPTGPASGWLGSATRLPMPVPKGTESSVDVSRPGIKPLDEISDIFSGARHSDAGKDGTGSNLLPGMSGIGRSSVFADGSRSHLGGESDLFGGLTGAGGDRGSSVFDDSSKKTAKVPPSKLKDKAEPIPALAPVDDDDDADVPLIDEEFFKEQTRLDERPYQRTAGPESSTKLAERLMSDLAASSESNGGSAGSRPDYNRTDKSASGSNLFDDVTAMDIDLASEPGASGVNWLNPNAAGAQDSGPGSSIFLKPPAGDSSDPGRVDLSHIPMMGSTDDSKKMVPDAAYAGPASSVLKKEIDKTLRELTQGPGAVSFDMPDNGKIAWGTKESTLADQASMRMPITDDELDLASPPSGSVVGFGKKQKAKKDSDSVFDDAPEFPEGSAIGLGGSSIGGFSNDLNERPSASMSGSILGGMTSDKLRNTAADAAVETKKTKLSTPTPSLSDQEFELPDEPKSKRGSGLIVAACLLLGTAVGAAGMYFGMPSGDGKSTVVEGTKGGATGKLPSEQEGIRLLETGDPRGALLILKPVKDPTPEIAAARGQALWMTKVRDCAATNTKLNPNDPDITAAREDLKSVVDNAATLKTPAERTALLKAALNLGLILEATQKPGDAIIHYNTMAKQFASDGKFKQVFESAALRVNYARRDGGNAPMPDDKYSLSSETILELQDANLILLEFAMVQPSLDEAGFGFWQAVDFASKHQYKNAIDALTRASNAHEKQRRNLIGMGLNPLSDPTEQMFLRLCKELKFYYDFKGKIYDDEVVGKLARTKDVATSGAIRQMIDAYKAKDKNTSELAAEKQRTEAVKAEVTTALAKAATAETAAKAAMTNETKLKDELQVATTKTVEVTKLLETEKKNATDAVAKQKTADAALDPIIAKMKELKLVDDKQTREQIVAALPELAKKPSFMAAGTGANADRVKELLADLDKAKVAKAAADKKVEELTTLTKDTKLQMDKAVADATRKATQDAADKLAAAELASKRVRELAALAQTKAEQQLKEQAEQFRSQIAAARAGAAVTITDVERDALDKAARQYDTGLAAYGAGRWTDAETAFAAAAAKNANDARYWYYLGLSKARQGKDAQADYDRGARLEARSMPSPSAVSVDLEPIQGELRIQLERLRP